MNNFTNWRGGQKLEECFLFTQYDGRYMHPDSVGDILRGFAKKLGLDHINTHAFCHTYGSLLILDGVDIATVSKLLGHASIETAMWYYAHLMGDKGKVSQTHMTALLDEIE